MGVQHLSDVLGVGEVQGSVHLIQDVERSRYEEEQRKDERESYQGSACVKPGNN